MPQAPCPSTGTLTCSQQLMTHMNLVLYVSMEGACVPLTILATLHHWNPMLC